MKTVIISSLFALVAAGCGPVNCVRVSCEASTTNTTTTVAAVQVQSQAR